MINKKYREYVLNAYFVGVLTLPSFKGPIVVNGLCSIDINSHRFNSIKISTYSP